MEDQLNWYYYDAKVEDTEKATKGPFAERDLDVLIRTGTINSGTLVFKTGMEDWIPVFEVPELKKIIIDQSNEIFQLQTKSLGRKLSSDEEKEDVPKQKTNNGENQQEDQPDPDDDKSGEEEENGLNDEQRMEMLKKKIEKNKRKSLKEKEKKRQQWYNPRINTNVYIQGLPPDITEEQMVEFFSKAGVIRINHQTLKPIVKIYRGEDGTCKGDGLVSYKMVESVEIAREVLDEKEISPGYRVIVQEAQFQQKGDYKARETKKMDKVQKEIAKNKEKEIMAWEADEIVDHGLKIVVLLGMFDPTKELDDQFYQDLEEDIIAEVEEQVGNIQKFEIFKGHPKGAVKIKFQTSYDASQCIGVMNGRFFDKRKIECFYWDGKTNYKREAEKEQNKNEEERLEDFARWLEGDGENKAQQEG